MEYEFLRRLYMSCSDEPSNGFVEGLNLSELYERIEETSLEDRSFTEIVNSTGLSCEERNGLEDARCTVSGAYELQGFINGFRLCWILQEEMEKPPDRRQSGGRT